MNKAVSSKLYGKRLILVVSSVVCVRFGDRITGIRYNLEFTEVWITRDANPRAATAVFIRVW